MKDKGDYGVQESLIELKKTVFDFKILSETVTGRHKLRILLESQSERSSFISLMPETNNIVCGFHIDLLEQGRGATK